MPTRIAKRCTRVFLLRNSRRFVVCAAVLSALSLQQIAGGSHVPMKSAKIDNAVLVASAPAKFGAYAPPSPETGMNAVTSLESVIARPIEVTSFYQAWGDGDHGAFHGEWAAAAASGGRDVLLTWEPWTSGGPAEQPNFSLARIIDGSYDSYINTWAKQIRSYGRTVYLRPMHEMNGDWYPWSGVTNGNTVSEYVAAWKKIHGIFSRNRVRNVKFVWSPLVDDVPSTNKFEQYYPGSAYVDVLALDGYNWGTFGPNYGWRSFETTFAGAYDRISKLGSQPIWITETGSAADGGDKAQWIREMFAVLPTRFPRVRALVWFNATYPGQPDWRVTTPASAAEAF